LRSSITVQDRGQRVGCTEINAEYRTILSIELAQTAFVQRGDEIMDLGFQLALKDHDNPLGLYFGHDAGKREAGTIKDGDLDFHFLASGEALVALEIDPFAQHATIEEHVEAAQFQRETPAGHAQAPLRVGPTQGCKNHLAFDEFQHLMFSCSYSFAIHDVQE